MIRFALTLALALTFLVVPPARPASAAGVDFEQRVIEIVNQTRAGAGLAPVAANPLLATSARRYASYMASASFFGHNGPDGSTLVTRDEAAGYGGWLFLGENLAGGQTTPEQVVDAWMNSPSHRENILSSNARELGVGYVYQPGSTYGHYWVQEFGARSGAPVAAAAHAEAPTVGNVLGASTYPTPTTPPSQLRAPTGGVDTLGATLSDVVRDPATGRYVQYFQRAVLEWHPENPVTTRVQRRLIGDLANPGADAPVSESATPPGPYQYFPMSADRPTGLGHFVANFTVEGQPTHFKEFFDAHGGVGTFGYPKEEPRLRNGLWTQRFQAATLQYHPEFDVDGVIPGTNIASRTYRVQMELLGERAFQTAH
jgi:uncharacterized protein YkwD